MQLLAINVKYNSKNMFSTISAVISSWSYNDENRFYKLVEKEIISRYGTLI